MINKAWLATILAAPLLAAWPPCKKEERPLEFQGVVELEERALGFEIGGTVERVEVRRGDAIKRDQALASLDDTLEDIARTARAAEVDAAKAQLALLKAGARPEEIRAAESEAYGIKSTETFLSKNLKRERELAKTGVSTQSAVEELSTKLATARAQRHSALQQLKALRKGARPEEIETAEAKRRQAETTLKLESQRIARHSIRAPLDGVILDVHVEPGEVVGPGVPVVTVGDVKHPYAEVFVPTEQLGGIEVGTPASVRVDSVPAPFSAKVEHVSRRTEFTPRYLFSERERPNLVVRVRLRIEDPEQKLHAGLPAFAKIERGAPKAP